MVSLDGDSQGRQSHSDRTRHEGQIDIRERVWTAYSAGTDREQPKRADILPL
jgi:hypothetical protein